MKNYIFLLLFIFSASNLKSEILTFDPTAAANSVIQISHLVEMIEHQADMAKKVGDGNFTPQTIGWMSNWWSKCGGGKYTLPDWFPHPKLDICADGNASITAGVNWYKENWLPLKSDKDKPGAVSEKNNKREEARTQIRGFALSASILGMQRAKEDQKAVENLQQGLTGAKDQISVQKIQTQVMIQMLAELQRVNQQQAQIIQLMAVKD
ncbi:MAG: hypothetical protein LBH40_03010 [Alphaproteobacteria bacterium]|jgi:hypothetical protein|nr:hypothetical protein [Alphaproteobacteria bacterium]